MVFLRSFPPSSFRSTVEDALQRHRAAQSGGGRAPLFGDTFALSFLPVAAVEEPRRLQARPVDAVETAGVDGDLVGLRARHVKGVHAAMRAKGVLGHAGAEGIGGQRIFTSKKLEILRRGNEVEDSLLSAYRAIALRQPVQVDPGAEPYPTAVAAALTSFKHSSHSLIRIPPG